VHFLATIFFRKMVLILYFNFYYRFSFFHERKVQNFSFEFFDKKLFKIIFLLILVKFFWIFPIYILINSAINFSATEQEFDEAILNRYHDYKIRVSLRGKKKILKYKKYLLDPNINDKYKFYPAYLSNDKNHVNLLYGSDFKFCKFLHNQMFKNNTI
jgi:hypothetical protein